jgi:anti-sigma28 factor (negative regulator of flagellin synthesis)
MAVISRTHRTKGSSAKSDFLSTRSGPEVAREARIAELRHLVASGRYHVEPAKLALKIFARALARSGDI